MNCLVRYFGFLLTVPLAGFSGDTDKVTVKRGEDMTLECRAPREAAIEQLAWSRADLKTHKYVFFLRDNRPLISSQLPSYRGRVELMDPAMKNGNASVILRNVTINDTGTYKCEIGWSSTGRELISTIKLKVQDSGQTFRPHLGQNITLTCQVSNNATIAAAWWARPDLKSEYVFYYRDGQSDTDIQHPSFKGRVELVESELKDGNLSVVLMNVSSSDYGEYTCGFKERKEGTIVTNEVTCIITLIKPDQHVTVHPGDDVTLRCEAADVSILAVEWTRPDLESEYVLLYRDGHLERKKQHPSFKGRVELVDRELKDGDVSLTLKNVSSRDTGTYECRVAAGGSRRRKRANIKTDPIRVIYLEVTGAEKVNYMGGNFPPLHVGLAAGCGVVAVLLVAAAVFVVWIYKRRTDQRSKQPAADEAGNDQPMLTSAV